MAGHKLVGVRLGRAAGKTKFTVLDEDSVRFIKQFTLEPRMVVDYDGNGTRIYAYAYETRKGRNNAKKLHEILWDYYCGGRTDEAEVVHINGITVDNRIENLRLVEPGENVVTPFTIPVNPDSAYYHVIKCIPEDPIEESFLELSSMRCYGRNGEIFADYDRNLSLYECHYRPCSNIEKEVGEFSVCGYCNKVRYCGSSCQQTDWAVHKKHCRPRKQRHRYIGDRPER